MDMQVFNNSLLTKEKLVLISGLLSLIAGCTNSDAVSQKPVQIDGSSTVYPITQLAIQKFSKSQPDGGAIIVQKKGTEAGFDQFCAGETDINDASRPILLREMDACKQNGVTYLELPIAFDAVTIVVNEKNSWAENITLAELKKLWATSAEGKIKTWNQIRPSWPNKPVNLYGPDKKSGTLDYFTSALGLPEHGVRSDYTGNSDAAILAQKVGRDPAGISFFGYGYYKGNRKHLKALAIDSGKGAVLPSQQSVNDNQYQPFSRPLLLYINARSAQVKPNVKTFADYYLSNAGSLAEEGGYFPLSADAYRLNTIHYHENKPGTVFAGETAVKLTMSQLLKKKSIF